MGATITILNLVTASEVPTYQPVKMTTKAFNAVATYELMRQRTLAFSVNNTDSARQCIIPSSQKITLANGNAWVVPQTQFLIEGQYYDIYGPYTQNSGPNNKTDVNANHVLCRLNNYTLPAGYSFVGTVSALIQDMLNKSGANVAFTVGTCAAVSGSYALNNTSPTNLLGALYGLTKLGVEIYFDNFTINAPVQVGSATGKTFSFGRDLCSLDRKWDLDINENPAWSYVIDIATLMRLPGGSPSDAFAVGDTVNIQDKFIGDQITGQRIVSYIKCLDDPTQDSVTVGQFVPDNATAVVAMQIGIASSVQQGDQYSNVSIDHQNGFMAVNQAQTLKVVMNAVNCFAIYSGDGNGNWSVDPIAELDANGLQAGTLRTPGSLVTGTIGDTQAGNLGFLLIDSEGNIRFCEIAELADGGMVLTNKDRACVYIDDSQSTLLFVGSGGSMVSQVECDARGVDITGEIFAGAGICIDNPTNGYYNDLTTDPSDGRLKINTVRAFSGTTAEGFNFNNGIFTGGGPSSVWNGMITYATGHTITVAGGLITAVT